MRPEARLLALVASGLMMPAIAGTERGHPVEGAPGGFFNIYDKTGPGMTNDKP